MLSLHLIMEKKYVFETRMQVRDYECDIEGIVNNANYDGRLCFRAQAELVCIVNGRLSGSEDYDRAFAPYIE